MFGFWRKHREEREAEQRGLAYPDAAFSALFGAVPTIAGPCVTPANAMQCAPVRCAVQVISEAIGQLPIHVYQRAADGSRERAPDHPAYALLHEDANPWTPASDLKEQLTRDALLEGDGLAFINRSQNRPAELLRLTPGAVSIEADQMTGEPVYKVWEGNSQRVIPREDILHIKAPSLNGIRGESPVRQCREAIALAMTMEQHAARLFGNGGRPSGLLKFPNKLGAESATRIRDSWHAAHAGENSGKTAVLEEGGEFQALSLTSVDAQFLEMRKFAIEEIARVYRVPPVFLMEYGRATWSNSEEMGRQFLTYCLMAWVKRWEGEIRLMACCRFFGHQVKLA